jgi:hypothetical protein
VSIRRHLCEEHLRRITNKAVVFTGSNTFSLSLLCSRAFPRALLSLFHLASHYFTTPPSTINHLIMDLGVATDSVSANMTSTPTQGSSQFFSLVFTH